MPPRVSVVITAYNSAAFIQRTLEGVARQSFTDYEIVVVDDDSTDGTAQAARHFHNGQGALAEELAWKAWRENPMSAHNLAALFRFARGKKPAVSHGA